MTMLVVPTECIVFKVALFVALNVVYVSLQVQFDAADLLQCCLINACLIGIAEHMVCTYEQLVSSTMLLCVHPP